MRHLNQISILVGFIHLLASTGSATANHGSNDNSSNNDTDNHDKDITAAATTIAELQTEIRPLLVEKRDDDARIQTNNCSLSIDDGSSILHGRCQIPEAEHKGEWVASVIDLNRCFKNDAGKVVYTAGQDGGFWDTCRDCKLTDKYAMQCMCYTGIKGPVGHPDKADTWVLSPVPLDLLNVNLYSGYLVCGWSGGFTVSDTPTLVRTNAIGHGPVTVVMGGADNKHSSYSHSHTHITKKPKPKTTTTTVRTATATTTTTKKKSSPTPPPPSTKTHETTAAHPPPTHESTPTPTTTLTKAATGTGTGTGASALAKTTPGYFITQLLGRDLFW